MADRLPFLPPPPCEWIPPDSSEKCGGPAEWILVTHPLTGVHEPDEEQVWLCCAGCALGVLQWVQREQEQAAASFCHVCNTMLIPTDGKFLIRHERIDGRPVA